MREVNEFHRLDQFFTMMADAGVYSRFRNLRYYFAQVFRDVDLNGKSMLDIGGGAGIMSLYAACRGASHVVCLEPSSAGSSGESAQTFRQLAHALSLDQVVQLLPITLQEFGAAERIFDIVLLHNSINHLDESACMRLQRSDKSKAVYDSFFQIISEKTAPGGTLIIADCSSRNLFHDLGLKNPFARTIEWHKHQPPDVWVEMLKKHGFVLKNLRWTSFDVLGDFGRILLGNRYASYFLRSHFCLTLIKEKSVV